jgi:hypothetical protein
MLLERLLGGNCKHFYVLSNLSAADIYDELKKNTLKQLKQCKSNIDTIRNVLT